MSKSEVAPSSSSSAPAKRYKPMDRDEEISTLKGFIAEIKATLSSIISDIRSLSNKRRALLEKDELSSREEKLLTATEEDLARAEKTEDNLRADIAKHEAELQELCKQPSLAASSPLTALPTGNFCAVHKYITLFIYIYILFYIFSYTFDNNVYLAILRCIMFDFIQY